MSSIAFNKVQEDLVLYEKRKKYLESINLDQNTDDKIKEFIKDVKLWYNIYNCYGRKIYLERSYIFKQLYYNEKLEKTGKDAANLNMKEFKKFLRKDMDNEIKKIDETILCLKKDIGQL